MDGTNYILARFDILPLSFLLQFRIQIGKVLYLLAAILQRLHRLIKMVLYTVAQAVETIM